MSTSHRQEKKVYKGISNETEMSKAVRLQCRAIVSRITTSRTMLSCLQMLNYFPDEKKKKIDKKKQKREAIMSHKTRKKCSNFQGHDCQSPHPTFCMRENTGVMPFWAFSSVSILRNHYFEGTMYKFENPNIISSESKVHLGTQFQNIEIHRVKTFFFF